MAALHEALNVLSPVAYAAVPQESLREYLRDIFSKCQALVDSVPVPAADTTARPGRSRSNTTSSMASGASEISASSARPDAPIPAHGELQKEWGQPLKLAPKDNPLGMGVYRLSSKDGRGSWFARRSVHEGLGFDRWKRGLQKEFPDSLEIQAGPGGGNVRGIGGERRVERKRVAGVGIMEVYHLSAQFPGPTAPRDFVELILTSSAAFDDTPSSSGTTQRRGNSPRHYLVISKPCRHPDCPERDGFVRGQYESIEFIREIPVVKIRKSFSTTDLSLPTEGSKGSRSLEKEAILRNARNMSGSRDVSTSDLRLPDAAEGTKAEGRSRGKTISFSESRGQEAKGEALDSPKDEENPELNPVEWVMITRSDPGGSVPRFMVERGTPSSIVADASKFLDWACKQDHEDGYSDSELDLNRQDNREKAESGDPNGPLSGQEDASLANNANGSAPSPAGSIHESNMARREVFTRTPSSSSSISSASFASAEDWCSEIGGASHPPSTTTESTSTERASPYERKREQLAAKYAQEATKVAARKAKEELKLARAHEKADQNYRKDMAKVEAWHARSIASLEEKRRKENDREEQRRRRTEKTE